MQNRDLNKICKDDYMWKIQFALRLELVAEALNNEDNLGNVTKSRMIKLNEE